MTVFVDSFLDTLSHQTSQSQMISFTSSHRKYQTFRVGVNLLSQQTPILLEPWHTSPS